MPEQDLWDSEDRDSPYSTVADPNDEDYCEGCDQMVDYTTSDPHGTCGCSPVVPTTGWLVNGRPVL